MSSMSFCVFSLLLFVVCLVFFFKQKTAYEMRISDWSSDVCSSDLPLPRAPTLLSERTPDREREGMSHSNKESRMTYWTAALLALALAASPAGARTKAPPVVEGQTPQQQVDRKSGVTGKGA